MTVRKGSRLLAAANFAFSSTSSSIDSVVLMVDLRRQESRKHHSIKYSDVKASSNRAARHGFMNSPAAALRSRWNAECKKKCSTWSLKWTSLTATMLAVLMPVAAAWAPAGDSDRFAYS